MEKKMIKREVKAVYDLLLGAKMNSMTGAEKLSLVRILRAMKPVAVEFTDASKDIEQKMKPENYDERLRKAIAYEQKKQNPEITVEQPEMTDEEYHAFIQELQEYRQLVAKAIDELGGEEVELNAEPLTEGAMEHLLQDNEWSTEQVMNIDDVLSV